MSHPIAPDANSTPLLVGHVRSINASVLYRIGDAEASRRFVDENGNRALQLLRPSESDVSMMLGSEEASSSSSVWFVSSSIGAGEASVHRLSDSHVALCEPPPLSLEEERKHGDGDIPSDIVEQGDDAMRRIPSAGARRVGEVDVPSGQLAVTYAFASGDSVAAALARLPSAVGAARASSVNDLQEADGVVLAVPPGRYGIFVEDVPLLRSSYDEGFCVVVIRRC